MPRMNDPTGTKMLDLMLKEQKEGTYRDPVAEAKAFDQRLDMPGKSVWGDIQRESGMKTAQDVINRGPDYGYGRAAVETLGESSLPIASMASGPAGWGAQAMLALKSIQDFANDPSKATGLGVGMNLLPFGLSKLGRLGKGGMQGAKELKDLTVLTESAPNATKAGKEIVGGANAGRAAMFDDVLSRQTGSTPTSQVFDMTGNSGRVGYSRPTEFNPSEAFMPNTPNPMAGAASGDDAAMALESLISQHSPNLPANAGGFGEPAHQLVTGIDRYAPNLPAESAASIAQRTQQATMPERAAFNRLAPDVVDAERVMPGESAASVAAPGFSLGSVTPMSDVPTSKAALKAMQRASKRGKPRGPTTNEGEVAGFSGLPELSDGEAARIAANIKRITGR